MRIVLLNSSTVSKPKDYIQHTWPWLRIGVASIAAYLRSKGHDIFLFDPQAENLEAGEAADKACSFRPDYVGLSAYTHEIHDAAEIARHIKERVPQAVIVVGGYHPSLRSRVRNLYNRISSNEVRKGATFYLLTSTS